MKNVSTFAGNVVLFQPAKPAVDTSQLFFFQIENEGMRVINHCVNCLYNGLTRKTFNTAYNYLSKYLHFDFSPVAVGNEIYSLSEPDQRCLEQSTLTSSIYLHCIGFPPNQPPARLSLSKLMMHNPLDDVISLLDKRNGVDTPVSLALGAKILRQNFGDYCETVKGRRQYYDK